MSSSYRKSSKLRCIVAGAVLVAAVSGPALAADTYVEPKAELRFENNDNFNLVPGGSSDSDVYGYIADVQAQIGIATQRSDTSIRPRVRFQDYPDRDDFEEFEAFLDLKSVYKWQRSQLLTIAKYSHEDSYNADTPGGEFDPDDPGDPGNPDAGTAIIGETRDRFVFEPEFTHNLTERTKLGVSADYQAVTYDSDTVSTRTDYDYYGGKAFVGWTLNPRSEIRVGGYGSKYEADDGSTETDAVGIDLSYLYQWSESTGIELTTFYEENDTTDFIPVAVDDTTSGWGGGLSAFGRGEVSSWRVYAGRAYVPTGAGGKAESDQFRVQYDRDLTQRVALLTAARYEARTALTDRGAADNRDYARADLSLRWMFTPVWFFQGGYTYIWQDREQATGDADNNRVFVSVGYKALERQRR